MKKHFCWPSISEAKGFRCGNTQSLSKIRDLVSRGEMCVKRDIFGKGRICQLEALAGVCFEKAELAVPRDCCLEIGPGRQNIERIFSMHEFKGSFRVGDHNECVPDVWGNIGDNSILGDLSEELLRRQVKYAKTHGIGRFVFHPGFTNIFVCKKDDALDTVARRLKRIYDSLVDKKTEELGVKLCIENSEFRWDLTAYHNERLVVDACDTVELLKRCEKEGIPQDVMRVVVDIEHLYVTAMFTPVYERIKRLYEELSCPSSCLKAKENADNQAEREFFEHWCEKEPLDEIRRFVRKFFEELGTRIEAVHVCGSDYKMYRKPKKKKETTAKKVTTTVGSHLPICYRGPSFGEHVQDRVRHEEYLKLMDELGIPKSVPLIVEVTSKPKGGDYIQCVSKSRDSLARIQRNLCHA